MDLKNFLTQKQTLAMTPQLQQAIKLLQLPNLDLFPYLSNICEANPLLILESNELTEALDGDEENYEDLWFESSSSLFSSGGSDARMSTQLHTQQYHISLQDHLIAQINQHFSDPQQYKIAQYFLIHLNVDGYLDLDLSALAEGGFASLPDLEAVLAELQALDPPGVFARNLSECLTIQLKQHADFDEATLSLLNHLDLLAHNDIAKMQRKFKLSLEELTEKVNLIRNLVPKPASLFDFDSPQTVIPDVIVEKDKNRWQARINHETLPKVRLDHSYYNNILGSPLKSNEAQYLKDCYTNGNYLIQALQQRYNTMLKVSNAIIEHQTQFLEHGIVALQSLTLKAIADIINMHESTVSRVTKDKYIATPHGVYPFKFFFGQGDSISTKNTPPNAIKARIKELITHETTPLSDEEIAATLAKQGINIARRTVAKYRAQLNLPVAQWRKKSR